MCDKILRCESFDTNAKFKENKNKDLVKNLNKNRYSFGKHVLHCLFLSREFQVFYEPSTNMNICAKSSYLCLVRSFEENRQVPIVETFNVQRSYCNGF